MKKLLIFLLFMACIGLQAQTIARPGRTVLVSNLAIAGIGGADTTFKFRMPEGCSSYSIGIIQTDTIEADADISAFLYGGNTGVSDVQIGDSLILADDAVTQVDYWTGTTFPYYNGAVKVRKLTTTDGDINIILFYSK